MKIAVLGTGMVGTTLATKLVSLGHSVSLGSRSVENDKGKAWLAAVQSPLSSLKTFADAAAGAELILNATLGAASLEALQAAGAENLEGKIVVDTSNPLDFSQGMPPRLSICNDSSLGEQIQAAFPGARVVKALNTVANPVMVNPALLNGPSALFIAGDDAEAKAFVEKTLLRDWFGWEQVIDLGGITAARGMEMYLALWVRMYGSLKTPLFNVSVVGART